MGNCASSSGVAPGVRIEVLERLLKEAHDVYDAAGPLALPAKPSGFGQVCRPRVETDGRLLRSITMEMVATTAIRPRALKAKRSYARWLADQPDTIPIPNGHPLGAAQVLLMTGENSPADTVLGLLKALGLPADTYYYLDEIASYDALARTSEPSPFTPMSPKPARPPPSFLSKGGGGGGGGGGGEESLRGRSLSSMSSLSMLASPQTQERRHVARREDYWTRDFLDAVEQVDKAVFVVDGVNDVFVCKSMRDLQWLYALQAALASKRPTEVVMLTPEADKAAFKEIMLEKTSRLLFLRALKRATLEHARARTPLEESALRDALGAGREVAAAEARLAARLAEWMVGEWTELLDEMERTIGSQREPIRDDFFESYKAFVGQLLELDREALALARATKLRDVCVVLFGVNDENTLDASNILANLLRRLGRVDEAIGIYADISERATSARAMLAASSKTRSTRLAGAQMQLANTLRDQGQHAAAETHYRAALDASERHMGADALNTHYCQISLANNLRAQSAAAAPGGVLLRAISTRALAHGPPAAAAAPPGALARRASAAGAPARPRTPIELLAQAEALYRAAAAGLMEKYSTLDNVTISARLNHACVLLEMSAHDRRHADEASALLRELRARSAAVFGERHECTVYIEAKQGELLARYKGDPVKGRAMLHQALRTLSRELGLSDRHPRVAETRATLAALAGLRAPPQAPAARKPSVSGTAAAAASAAKAGRKPSE